jgi:hypothetical protein
LPPGQFFRSADRRDFDEFEEPPKGRIEIGINLRQDRVERRHIISLQILPIKINDQAVHAKPQVASVRSLPQSSLSPHCTQQNPHRLQASLTADEDAGAPAIRPFYWDGLNCLNWKFVMTASCGLLGGGWFK